MMATALPRALGKRRPEAIPADEYMDPYAAMIEAARLKLNNPQRPMYTPEEVEQRRAENNRQYQLGLLGQMSGDEAIGNVGGQLLKQALAARQQRVTERGVADPLTGQFTNDPDHMRQTQEQALSQLEAKSAAARGTYAEQRQRAAERAEEKRRHDETLRAMQAMRSANGNSNEPLVQVIDPATGQAVFIRRSQAIGMTPASGANIPENERNASGYAVRMVEATKLLDELESTGRPTYTTKGIGAMYKVGPTLERAAMSPAQQRYRQAQEDWVRAKLRKESGASIGSDEMEREITTYFPQPGETDPSVLEQKRRSREVATQAMVFSGGRGYQPTKVPPSPSVATKPDAGSNAGSDLSDTEAAELAELRARLRAGQTGGK